MGRARSNLRKRMRKHGWFAAALAAILLILLLAYLRGQHSDAGDASRVPHMNPE